ncbi:MAG: glycoside hydrolase family 2 TIM barrel-domain containing protein [Clostridia bacterium]
MQQKIYINDNWDFHKISDNKIVKVRLPHSNIETPLNYFSEEDYQFISVYSRKLFAENSWSNKKVLLTFEAVAHVAKIYLNDKLIFTHKGGYTAFTVDLTEHLNFGSDNKLSVEVDSRECVNVPPFGNVIDYLTYGGIYREVYLEIKNSSYINDVFVKTDDEYVIAEIDTQNHNSKMHVKTFLRKKDTENWEFLECEKLNKNKLIIKSSCKMEKWDIQNPVLYEYKTVLENDNQIIDEKIVTFGHRKCEFKKDGFFLNGKKIKLVGVNRHQSYAYVGYAMPKRPQQLDADILKNELCLNAVRTSHYPQSQHFIQRCDEIGLLVFTEIPGWQYIGDDDWKEIAVQNAKEMVLQYRNHPSIILWGARINESADDNEFYTKTNDIIHSLDSTRQTGGVRCIKNSSLLEDVYTYNDFSHTGKNSGLEPKNKVTSDNKKPYLVSEYGGHMFPTKAFDNETHRLKHALRHANVLNSMHKHEDIAGSFAWCMFDYNTHKDFGSGDRICYHGVMDMFRNPKLASSVYASQSEEKTVLKISSSMDIGEYPACNLGDVYAFTNADYVKLYKNDDFVKDFHPDTDKFSSLPHAPILIDDFVGQLMEIKEDYSHEKSELIKSILKAVAKYGQNNLPLKYKLKMLKAMFFHKLTIADGTRLFSNYIANWGGKATTYRFEAIKNGKIVKIVEKTACQKAKLVAISDTLTLCEENSYDVASIRIKVTNEKCEILPYYQGVVSFECSGNIEIIGTKHASLIGGNVGTYVKTTGEAGKAQLKITSFGLEDIVLDFEIIKI